MGIQESSSDILVQNCDEYYSYTNLAVLTKTTETDVKSVDPWVLVEKAVKRMQDRDDVMRSDRLKQVMIELDSTFDEGTYGFSKFSKFVTEAASRDLIQLKKMPNGQYEIAPGGKSAGASRGGNGRDRDEDRGRSGRSRRGRGGRSEGADTPRAEAEPRREPEAKREPAAEESGKESQEGTQAGDLQAAYDLLRDALERLKEDGRYPVRDSDVKRRMREIEEDFDESTLGFSKFSRFLRQAHDDEVIDLAKQEGGSYEVTLREEGAGRPRRKPEAREEAAPDEGRKAEAEEAAPETEHSGAAVAGTVVEELTPEEILEAEAAGRRLGPRGGTTRRRGGDEPPPLFEGQGRPASGASETAEAGGAGDGEAEGFDPESVSLSELDLPKGEDRVVRYLTRYKGVGEKTARQFVDHFGDDSFQVLHERPEEVKDVVPASRADQLVAGWQEDIKRRASGENSGEGRSRGRRGGRNRRGGRSGRGGRNDG